MNHLSRYLKFSAVRLDLDIASQKRLFEEASFALQTAYGVPHDEVFAALSERERIGSTALGKGCAVPHGRMQALSSPAVAFLRTVKPLKLPSPDGTGAQLFIAILVPWEHPEQHLALLRESARLFSDDAVRANLLEAKTPAEFCECITAWNSPAEEEEDQNEEDVASSAEAEESINTNSTDLPTEERINEDTSEIVNPELHAIDEERHAVTAPNGIKIVPEGE